jgi:aminomethyltransferase
VAAASAISGGVDAILPAAAAMDPALAGRPVATSAGGDSLCQVARPSGDGRRDWELTHVDDCTGVFGVGDQPLALDGLDAGPLTVGGIPCFVTRSGYTGEDGYEISVAADQAEKLARHFLEMPDCVPAGLGARDSLRLEAGLPLYGSDIDTTTSPVEAGLEFAIGKRRRTEGGFPGAERILGDLKDGVSRRRVGLKPSGRAPARAHTEIHDTNGHLIGEVTSGGFGPTVEGPVAMGYVATALSEPGTPVVLMVRGKPLDAHVVALPFVEQRYHRG